MEKKYTSEHRPQRGARLSAQLANAHEALRRIRDARDHCAEHGVYPPDFGVDGYECFDDWAADIAATVLRGSSNG
jgi:hypothetical protein